MSNRTIKALLTLCFSFTALFLTDAAFAAAFQTNDPGVEPRSRVALLNGWKGDWVLSTAYSQDGGSTWQNMPENLVTYTSIQKGMAIRETVSDPTIAGFHSELTFSFDQYRNHYRLSLLDDTWGVMDMYEGEIEGDQLVMTNLRSDTSFPIGNGQSLHFKLSAALEGDTRVTDILASTDKGNSWFPYLRFTYMRAK